MITNTDENIKNTDYNKLWHYPAAYWFWHYIPNEAEIENQLNQMKNAGIMSFQIAVRLSMPLKDYLNKEYLNACKITAQKASDLGMMMGVYDEYNWLSGHAGGKVVEKNPKLKETQLFWTKIKLEFNENNSIKSIKGTVSDIYSDDADCLFDIGKNWIYENGKPLWDNWQIISIVAVKNKIKNSNEIIDLTKYGKFSCVDEKHCEITIDEDALKDKNLEDFFAEYEIIAFISARCFTSRMVNYLLEETSKEFIEVDYEPYRKAFGEYFGKTVQYMFFDQPHSCFYKWKEHFGFVKTSLMADKNFFDKLNNDKKLAARLASLVKNIGEDSSKYRCEFFAEYSKTGIKSFFAPLLKWCRKWGVKLSGHEVLSHVHSWDFTDTVITEDARCNFGMDYFSIDSYRDITAVDAKNSKVQLSAKMGDSVAISHGRSKCLLEQYYGCQRVGHHFGVGEWELELQQLRRQALRHHILGARQFLIHAIWLSNGKVQDENIFENPRWDFPPGINYEAWFKHYKEFAVESSNLSFFLDEMDKNKPEKEVNNNIDDVLLVYPLRTFWGKGIDKSIGAYSAKWAEYLSKLQYEYHFINEDDFIKSFNEIKNQDDKSDIIIGNIKSKAIVFPYCEVISSIETLNAAEKFLKNGIKIIFSGMLPQESQTNGKDLQLYSFAKELLEKYPDNCMYSKELPTKDLIENILAGTKKDRVHFQAVEKDFYNLDENTLWTKCSVDIKNNNKKRTYYTIFNDSPITAHGYLFTAQKSSIVKEYSITTGTFTAKKRISSSTPVTIKPFEVRCFIIKEDNNIQDIILKDNWHFKTADRYGNIKNIIKDDISLNYTLEQQNIKFDSYDDVGIYTLILNHLNKKKNYALILPKVYGGITVKLNGTVIDKKGWNPYEFILPTKFIDKKTKNILEIEVAPSSANYYYEGTKFKDKDYPMGIGSYPILRISNKKIQM